jgi:dolichol-phosphate mannosyltransferase
VPPHGHPGPAPGKLLRTGEADAATTQPIAGRARKIPELSVVMPAFNEAAVLPRSILEATAALDRLCDDWELVVVDDGSTDATPEVLSAAARQEPRLEVLTQETNRGYAAALARGFAACRREVIFYTDADAQFDLEELAMAYPLLAHADMVAGWRWDRKDPWLRKCLSSCFNVLQRWVLGTRVRDVDCAFKLFRRSFFEGVELTSSGFLIDAELYARAEMAGLRVVQIPVTHRPRAAGRSSIRPGTVWRCLFQLFALARALRDQRRCGLATVSRQAS